MKKIEDLMAGEKDGLYYENSSSIPFSGESRENASYFKNGLIKKI